MPAQKLFNFIKQTDSPPGGGPDLFKIDEQTIEALTMLHPQKRKIFPPEFKIFSKRPGRPIRKIWGEISSRDPKPSCNHYI